MLKRVAQVKAHIEADLVVAAPRRVEFAAHFADLLDQMLLDGHVDVFLGGGKVNFTPFDFPLNLPQAGHDPRCLFIGDDLAGAQHATVRNASFDIIADRASCRNGSRP